jgi:hypothetical protein
VVTSVPPPPLLPPDAINTILLEKNVAIHVRYLSNLLMIILLKTIDVIVVITN